MTLIDATQIPDPKITPPVPLRRNRDFLLLRGGQAVSVLGSRISTIAFPLLVLVITHSPAQAGLVGLLNSLPNLLFNLHAGVLADRWNRKRVMVLCDGGRFLAMGSIPLALWTGRFSIALVAVVAFIEGSLAVFFNVAETASIPRLVAKEQLATAYSQNEVVSRGSLMIGQPLGGFFFGLGQAVPFLADAISYAVSVFTLLFIGTEFQEERVARTSTIHEEIVEGVVWLWRHRFLRVSTFLVAATNLLWSANFLIIIVLARDQHASYTVIGLISAVGGVGGVVGSVVAPWIGRRLTLGQVVNSVNWLWAGLFPLFALAPNPLALALLMGIAVFAGPIWNVVLGSYMQALVPDELQGRVNSAETLVAWGTIPLGAGLSGVLVQAFGPITAVLTLAVAMILIAAAGSASPYIRNPPSIVGVTSMEGKTNADG